MGMSSVLSRLQRAALAAMVAAGLGLLGISVSGIAGMRSDLEAASWPAPAPLVDERPPAASDDRRCREPAPPQTVSPEV